MQQLNNSSCELFTITYVTNITFGLNLENLLTMCHKCDHICITT